MVDLEVQGGESMNEAILLPKLVVKVIQQNDVKWFAISNVTEIRAFHDWDEETSPEPLAVFSSNPRAEWMESDDWLDLFNLIDTEADAEIIFNNKLVAYWDAEKETAKIYEHAIDELLTKEVIE
jgi:hypothetical protein